MFIISVVLSSVGEFADGDAAIDVVWFTDPTVVIAAIAVVFIISGSGARGRWIFGNNLGGRGGAKGSPPFLRSM